MKDPRAACSRENPNTSLVIWSFSISPLLADFPLEFAYSIRCVDDGENKVPYIRSSRKVELNWLGIRIFHESPLDFTIIPVHHDGFAYLLHGRLRDLDGVWVPTAKSVACTTIVHNQGVELFASIRIVNIVAASVAPIHGFALPSQNNFHPPPAVLAVIVRSNLGIAEWVWQICSGSAACILPCQWGEVGGSQDFHWKPACSPAFVSVSEHFRVESLRLIEIDWRQRGLDVSGCLRCGRSWLGCGLLWNRWGSVNQLSISPIRIVDVGILVRVELAVCIVNPNRCLLISWVNLEEIAKSTKPASLAVSPLFPIE